MALKGIKVIEMAGLAPSPFAGLLLADYGAEVIRVDQLKPILSTNILARGKKSISVNLKKTEGVDIVKKLVADADVIIEPFRPGVMEKLGLGPDTLQNINKRLVYARLSGYGQSGPLSQAAGHDINYVAMTGVLSKLGRAKEKPFPPINLLADFAGGSILCVMGIVMALFSRNTSGHGQVVDASLTAGAAYASSFLFSSHNQLPMMWAGGKRGCNVLDSGCPYYNTYKTLDNKYMAVGALEPQFYAALLEGLDLNAADLPAQVDFSKWHILEQVFTEKFKTKTQKQWTNVFAEHDACVTPVLSFEEAAIHPHNIAREMFLETEGIREPAPSPKLSQTPAAPSLQIPVLGQDTLEILGKLGYDEATCRHLAASGVVTMATKTNDSQNE